MNPTVRNVFAVIIGLIIGSFVNMGLIMVSGSVIPLPEGVDQTSMESLKATMHLFDAKHFIMPFLAHALGTLVGALVASFIAATHKFKFALVIGGFFLIGGITNVFMLPSPVWFAVLDIAMAYIPAAWIGYKIFESLKK